MTQVAIAELEQLTDTGFALTFDVPESMREEWAYKAGQHLTIVGDDGQRRSYSLCDAPGVGRWRVGIRKLPGGQFSRKVADLRPGDQLEVLPPSGRFWVEADPLCARHHVFVGAGSGITPLLAMMQEFLAGEAESRVTLLLGNKHPDSVMFAPDLAELTATYGERFVVHHFYSEHVGEEPLFNGRLDGMRFRKAMHLLVNPSGVDDWWICGPHKMTEMLTDTLLRVGVERAHVHSELFHVEQTRPAVKGDRAELTGTCAVRIIYRGETTELSIPRDGSDVLRHAITTRPDLPYSCRGGVCGTCRCLVTEGTAAMHSWWALEKADVDAGFVLGCQSYPLTDALTLDFDAAPPSG